VKSKKKTAEPYYAPKPLPQWGAAANQARYADPHEPSDGQTHMNVAMAAAALFGMSTFFAIPLFGGYFAAAVAMHYFPTLPSMILDHPFLTAMVFVLVLVAVAANAVRRSKGAA
jgi:hypothetical protein